MLFLILGVIRPAFRDMAKVPANTGNQGAGGMTAQQAMPNNSAGVSGEDIAKLTKGSDQMEEQMTNVRSLVQQDPALLAQVVKNWTAGEA